MVFLYIVYIFCFHINFDKITFCKKIPMKMHRNHKLNFCKKSAPIRFDSECLIHCLTREREKKQWGERAFKMNGTVISLNCLIRTI